MKATRKDTTNRQLGFCLPQFFLRRLPVQTQISKVEAKIDADETEIQHIEKHYVPLKSIGIQKLTGNARNVAKQNQHQKRQALALRRPRAVGFDRAQRPGKAEAQQHHGFKNILHGETPPESIIIIFGQFVRRYCTTFCRQKQIFISK